MALPGYVAFVAAFADHAPRGLPGVNHLAGAVKTPAATVSGPFASALVERSCLGKARIRAVTRDEKFPHAACVSRPETLWPQRPKRRC
jgi:hypothetical protein